MRGAVPGRLSEFRAGRRAARRALAALGLPPVALPMGPDRAPIWPPGICGSIAHAGGLAVAVVSRSGAVGVDLEEDAALDPDLWSTICSEREMDRLPLADRGLYLRRIFAAKEAVFKAQRAENRVMFGFEAVEVTLVETGFDAQFLSECGAFPAGSKVHGTLVPVAGMILAGVFA